VARTPREASSCKGMATPAGVEGHGRIVVDQLRVSYSENGQWSRAHSGGLRSSGQAEEVDFEAIQSKLCRSRKSTGSDAFLHY
jgi:hypothetical protein